MARPIKSGLDYFTLDIDFFEDEKIEFVSAKYGELGELIIVKLLSRIYRNGYYLEWDEDRCILFTKRVGKNITFELVNEVIEELLKRKFFNKSKFKKHGILTSHGIQKRYFKAVERRRHIRVISEYLLVNVDTNLINVDINSVNTNKSTQSKVKKSKVKNKREKMKAFGEFKHVLLTKEEYQNLLKKWGKNFLAHMIKILDEGIELKGYSYKNHNLAIQKWAKKEDEPDTKPTVYVD